MVAIADRNKTTRFNPVLTPTWGNSKANGQLFYLRITNHESVCTGLNLAVLFLRFRMP